MVPSDWLVTAMTVEKVAYLCTVYTSTPSRWTISYFPVGANIPPPPFFFHFHNFIMEGTFVQCILAGDIINVICRSVRSAVVEWVRTWSASMGTASGQCQLLTAEAEWSIARSSHCWWRTQTIVFLHRRQNVSRPRGAHCTAQWWTVRIRMSS